MGLLDRIFGGGGSAGPPGKPAEPDLPCPAADADEAARQVAGGAWAVLDVRFPGELEERRIPGSLAIPLPELPARAGEIEKDRETLVVCNGGRRSLEACRLLKERGAARLRWLRGGLDGWRGPLERGPAK